MDADPSPATVGSGQALKVSATNLRIISYDRKWQVALSHSVFGGRTVKIGILGVLLGLGQERRQVVDINSITDVMNEMAMLGASLVRSALGKKIL
jgi:hypothetical protein